MFPKVTTTVLLADTQGYGQAQQEGILVGQPLAQGLISKESITGLN